LEFDSKDYHQLYQFSAPTFISDEKILFSARKMDVSKMPDPGQSHYYVNIDMSRNTALFMSNFDGTKLQRVSENAIYQYYTINIK
jgi:hypothetical protein